jgi:hypothetical protein
MSTLKSVNWALAWRRSIWTVVWAAMMALLVVMCIDLAANQPVIFGIVMLAAFVGSIGLAYTRVSWQNGARATAGAALIVSLLAICTHAFMEASYWSSVIEQINQEVTAERAVSDARAAVAEKRKERYVSSSNGRSAGQIEAELKAAETNVLFARTASCADPTAQASREFCASYFLLKAKHAAAIEAGQLESVIWSAGTTVETTTKRNLASIAVMASNIFGGQPEQYTALIVITLVLFTQALLAFALVIGWAPEKPQEAAGASFQRPISLAGSFADPAYNSVSVAPGTPMEETRRKMAAMKAADSFALADHSSALTGKTEEQTPFEKIKSGLEEALEIVRKDTGTDPDGPGTPAPASEEPKIEEVAARSEKVISLFRDDGKGPETSRGKKKSHKPEGKVESWLGASTTQVDDPAVKTSSADCWRSYLAYCDTEGKQPMHRKVFSRKLGVLLGRASGKGRKRDAKGSVFTGLMINPVVMTARRRVA